MKLKVKKIMVMLMCAVMTATFLPTAIFAESTADFRISWIEKNGNLQGIATYQKSGVPYEMIINGVENQLDQDVLAEIAENLSKGKAMTITDAGIIDAEKFSAFAPMDYQSPIDIFVDMSGIREACDWGDSKMCWAASVANMLTSTGWTEKAINPDTGIPYADEDEVFSFFVRYCLNRGCLATNGISFFFSGKMSSESQSMIRYPYSGAFPGTDLSKYCYDVRICDGDQKDNTEAYSKSLQCINQLKDGGSIGLSLNLLGCEYTLKSDPGVFLEKIGNQYRSSPSIYVKKDLSDLPEGCALEKHFYAVNEKDEVVLLNKTENGYEDPSGRLIDPQLVKENLLFKTIDNTYLYPFQIDDTVYSFQYHVYYTEDQVNCKKNPLSFDTEGGHAVTANGYIKNLNTGLIEGLLITNSDNDSDFMPYEEENLSKENRPNCMVVYPVKEVKGVHNVSLALEDYNGNAAVITGMSLLMPEEEKQSDQQNPQASPKTGYDGGYWKVYWGALLALAALSFVAVRKKFFV